MSIDIYIEPAALQAIVICATVVVALSLWARLPRAEHGRVPDEEKIHDA